MVLFSHTMMSLAILSRSLRVVLLAEHRDERAPGSVLPEVVRNHYNAAAERVDCVGQGVDCGDVQAVGRFVQ